MAHQTRRSGGGAKIGMFILAIAGAAFLTIGLFFVMSQNAFSARSEEGQVTVTFVDRRQGDEGALYRPTFEARAAGGEVIEYTGVTWVRPKPHNEGDVVDGRVDWVTGEIRSASMMKTGTGLGIIFAILGGIILMVTLVIAGRMVKSVH